MVAMNVDALLSLTAAARELGCSPDTLKTLVDQGAVKCARVLPRGDRLFSPGDLAEFRRAHKRLPVRPGRKRFLPVNEALVK